MTHSRSLDDWLEYIQTVHFRSVDMSLERVDGVLQHIGEPSSFRIIAVAGTNGKGSCAAMLGSVLAACGHTVGVYTSPHLMRFNERVAVDGAPASDAEICRALEDIESERRDIPLTYFEFATLAAVLIFQRRNVTLAVMEVGMGGRLDAVNALSISASLVTNVALDHMAWLGRDREAIGREKAHIMRAGGTSVFAGEDPPRSLLEHAADIGTELLVAHREYDYEATGAGWRWFGPRGEAWTLEPPLTPGSGQIANAAGVLALLSGCEEPRLDAATAARGLGSVRVPARCEIVGRDPVVLIDVAHNPSAVETLRRQLIADPVAGKTRAVFGMLQDKDAGSVARAVDEHIDSWCVATIEDKRRGRSAREVAQALSGAVRGDLHCHDCAVDAFTCALEHSRRDDRVVVFGSFYIAGDILAHMKRPP